jgi:hypothetical protein
VEFVYNGLEQLTQEFESVSGPVNTATTPSIQYIYSELTDGNNSRLTQTVTGNARQRKVGQCKCRLHRPIALSDLQFAAL